MKLRGFAIASCLVPALAAGDPAPLAVTPSYVPRAHPPRHDGSGQPLDNGNPGYFYVSYGQDAAMFGAGAKITQEQPMVSSLDFHSLAEISVEDGSGAQIIEIGWNIDPGVNDGSVEPHLFSFHWIDGVGTCYNGCGWVQTSSMHAPGMKVDADHMPHTFQIEHRADARWWLTYDGDDMGYYPDTEWSGRYTEAAFTQWFGEVAAGTETMPCTQMGAGVPALDANAAFYTGIYRVGAGSAQVAADIRVTGISDSSAYSASSVTQTSFKFGGSGYLNPECVYDVDTAPPAGADGPPTVAADGPRPDAAADGRDAGNAEMGTGGGCCDARGSGGGDLLVAAGFAAVVLRRRHRDRRR